MPDYIGLLKELGYPADIKKIIAKAKLESVELQGKKKELERIKNSDKGGAKETDFTAWIISVSKYMGYRIDRHITPLLEFLMMDKQMMNEMEAKKKQMRNNLIK
jgi:hypothetical protein